VAAETNTLLGHGRRFEPGARRNPRQNTEIAVRALREKARA
jgi:hypothetical protein